MRSMDEESIVKREMRCCVGLECCSEDLKRTNFLEVDWPLYCNAQTCHFSVDSRLTAVYNLIQSRLASRANELDVLSMCRR